MNLAMQAMIIENKVIIDLDYDTLVNFMYKMCKIVGYKGDIE